MIPIVAPAKTDATTIGNSTLIAIANGIAIGIVIAIVSHEVPVQKAIKAETKKTTRGRSNADIIPSTAFTIYSAVPRSLQIAPNRLDTDLYHSSIQHTFCTY